MDALPFLDEIDKLPLKSVYVLHGDEDFLKRRIKLALIPKVIGDADPEFAVANYLGEQVEFSSLRGELETLPFLCERRLIFIDQAEKFVSENRPALEAYVAKPAKSGVLVLDIKTFPATTNLAKVLPKECSISCKAPAKGYLLIPWVVNWTKQEHGKKISKEAAEWLIEVVGLQMGLLAQELAKLAAFVGAKPAIERDDVDKVVARSRGANVFKILDAVGEANGRVALTILQELYDDGEDPIGILAAMAVQLRKLARAAHYVDRKMSMDAAMDRAKVPAWPEARQKFAKQLKHLGRNRLSKMYDWLVETDLGFKGGSQLPSRLLLQQLVVRLAKNRG